MGLQKALIIVDVQNDFCPGGGYPVPDGNEVVAPLNKMIKKAKEEKWLIVASRDWHPESSLKTEDWKPHCIKNTKGAEFPPDLKIDDSVKIISKGEFDMSDKHYSAFNGENLNLDEYLSKHHADEVFIGGLAYDFCVKNTALDAASLGYRTVVLKDACRGIFKKVTEEQVEKELLSKGVTITTVEKIIE